MDAARLDATRPLDGGGLDALDAGPDAPVWRNSDGTLSVRTPSGAIAILCGCVDDPVSLSLGPTLYGVVGRETQVFFDNLIAGDGSELTWTTYSPLVSESDQARWHTTPDAASEAPLFVIAWNAEGVAVGAASAVVHVSEASAGADTSVSVLFLGDSTTANGVYVHELNTLFASDVMSFVAVGTQGSAPDLHEGHSGWTIEDYATDRRGAGVNPFGDGGSFDYQYYLDTTGFDPPDVFFVHLGINDVFSVPDEGLDARMSSMLAQLDQVFASVRSTAPATRLAVGLTIVPCATESGFRASYPEQPQYTRARYKPRIVEWVRRLIEQYGGDSDIALVPLNATIDSTNGFPNESDGAGGLRHLNAVHPNELGYTQMAETIHAWLKAR